MTGVGHKYEVMVVWMVVWVVFCIIAFVIGWIIGRKAKANEARKRLKQEEEKKRSAEEATPPKWGPEVPGATQIAPGLYRINKAHSIFSRQEDKEDE